MGFGSRSKGWIVLFCFMASAACLPNLYAEENTGTAPLPDVVVESPNAKPVLKYLGTPIPLGRDDVTVRFGLHDAREKFMYLKNFNFNRSSDEAAYVNLLRFYPNVELKTGPYVKIFGASLARTDAARFIKKAKSGLNIFGAKADRLKEIADYILK